MYHARYEKPLKNHSLDVAKKYVETYSPSNAAARNLEEEVQTNPKPKTQNSPLRILKPLNRAIRIAISD